MRVVLERSGGLAGRRRTLRLAPPTLSGDGERRLRDALDRAGFHALPPRLAPGAPRPDAFHYRLMVEERGRPRTVEFSEGDAPESLLALVEEIEAVADDGPP